MLDFARNRAACTQHLPSVSALIVSALALSACPGREALDAGRDAGLDAIAARDASLPPDVPRPLSGLPVIPVGLDAYRMWDRLPYVRIGARTYMRSTYDRAGANEAVDAAHFLRQDADDRNVTLDVAGTGFLYFVRTNHWHGSPWHYVVDETDHVISESTTAHPDSPESGAVFLPEGLLPQPLAWTWDTTRGADLNWVPIGFERSFTLAYERTHYGTGYFIYQLVDPSADNLSQPVHAWDATPPPRDVLDLIARAGTDIAPVGTDVTIHEGTLHLAPGTAVDVASLAGGPTTIRALRFTVPIDRALAFGRARIRITWDDRALPSVDAPIALFFGTGTLYNRDDAEDLVKAFPVSVHFDRANGFVQLSTYLPMPFQHNARIEIVDAPEDIANVSFHLRTVALTESPSLAGYLHASYRDHGVPTPGQDLTLLDTRSVEAQNPRTEDTWCGSFIGTSLTFTDNAVLWTLEGDPRFYFDDSESPQAYGTGTEEWGGGGDYWGGRTMTLPFAGHPVGAPNAASARNAEDRIESAYRFLVADAMPFGRNARITLEHGGLNESTEHYRTLAFWYGVPGACLAPSNPLHVSDAQSESEHHYIAAPDSTIETVTSRYERGVDHLRGDPTMAETYPATEDTGRRMSGTSEFDLALAANNEGVLLRRKLDYSYADQRAEVFVQDATGAFVDAGTWYLAGSNTCVFSAPPGELDSSLHTLETSNRRWRDDEFLIPRRLTRGRDTIRVRIRTTSAPRPLVPGAPPPPAAWSEYRYSAYSWVVPVP